MDAGKAEICMGGIATGSDFLGGDWADESVGTAHIAVVKYPAADKEKKGTVFFNPGVLLTARCTPLVLI